jgi:hypothetical protein
MESWLPRNFLTWPHITTDYTDDTDKKLLIREIRAIRGQNFFQLMSMRACTERVRLPHNLREDRRGQA